MFQFRLALRYMWGRKLRTLLTTLSIVLGVGIIFGLNGLGPALQASFRQGAAAASLNIDLLATRDGMLVFEEDKLDAVREVPGVTDVTGLIVRDIALPDDLFTTGVGDEVRTMEVYGLDPATSQELFRIVTSEGRELAEGRTLQAGDGNTIIISRGLSDGTGVGLGEMLELPSAQGTTAFEVVGILSDHGLVLGEEQVFMPLSAAQGLFNVPGQINAIQGQYVEGADESAMEDAVLDVLGPGFTLGSIQGGADAWETLFEMATVIFTMFGVLALAMAGFIMFNTFRTIVAERQRDIGMLRAVGAERRTVQTLILIEALLQGLVGTALGLLLGYGLAQLTLPILSPIWEQLLGAPLGAPQFTPLTIILAVGLGITFPVLSSLIPARQASRVTPLEALRPSVAEVEREGDRKRLITGGVLALIAVLGLLSGQLPLAALGAVLFLVALSVVGPVIVRPLAETFGRVLRLIFAEEGRLAEGNLVRQPSRAAITASTITISLAILIALAGLATTATSGLLAYFDQSFQAEYLLLPESLILGAGDVGADPALAQEIAGTPGVEAVTSLRRTETAGAQIIGVDPQTFPELSGLVFTEGRPSEAYDRLNSGRTVIVNGMYAAQNGVSVGDTVELTTANGPQSYEVVGIGLDYLNAKLVTAYVSHENMARDFRINNDVLIMVERAEGASAAELETALLDITERYPTFGLMSYEQLRDTQLEGNQARNIALYIIMSLLAVPSLLALANTLSINVIERTREIGMMRAVGATRKQVRRIILAESLLLSAMGIAFGILAGVWLGYVMVGAMDLTGIPLPYNFPAGGVLTATAVGLLFGVLAAVAPARRASDLDIVAALAFE